MIDERKQREVDYYDKEVQSSFKKRESGSALEFNPFLLESYQFLKESFKDGYKDKIVLDYGCGTGIHLPWLSEISKEVIAIDLSENSVKKARELIEEKNLKNVKVLIGDCEKMDFAKESFDELQKVSSFFAH